MDIFGGLMEEIIIDGIDVSECCFYHNSKCDNPNGMACNCINNAVCYFKELKRLEQENKRLKFKLDTVEADYEADEIEIEDLKNKLNLLTTANNHLLQLDKYRQKELETKAEATKANIHNLALLSKANKTLQEIKAIAKESIKTTGMISAGFILQKITEAEEE
jgi:hypothetical protein